MSALLEVSGITAFYGASQALFGVDLIVNEGEAVALMMTEVRGASNAKAKRELGWEPRHPSLVRAFAERVV